MHRLRTLVHKHTAEDECLELHGILKREKYPDDL